jgi:hypothetical protein
VDEVEKKEFWAALGRLYSSTENLRVAAEKLAEIAAAHERRLDRSEVLLDALRDELNRLKGGRAQ